MRDRFRTGIACAVLAAATVASAGAQTTFRETGSVTVGSYLVWVRGTNARVVQLFVGRGFRDAFAKPHEMDAATVQRWIDSVRALPSLPANDSTLPDTAAHGAALSADVTMMRRVGGPYSGLRMLVSGEAPIAMAEPTTRDFIAALDSAVRVAQELSAPELVLPAPAADTAVAPHVEVPADKLIRTPLGPFTIPGALLGDRDKEARYCYTQLGLKYNPDLRGEISVRLSLAGDGTVRDAVVTKRSWQGISAGEVEACVRAIAHDWSVPPGDPAIAEGTKLLTFGFAP